MILNRYILREHVAPFCYSFFVITFLFIMDFLLQMVDSIFSKGLSIRDVLEMFVMNMAWMVALSVPMSVLVAALMAFGRLSSDNEIIVLKASGLHSLRIIMPSLLLSLVIAGGLVWFNNRVLPEANHRASLLYLDITQKKPAAFIKEGFIIDDFPGYRIIVGRVDALSGVMYDIKIYQEEAGHKTLTFAKRGNIEYINRGEVIRFVLYGGESHREDVNNNGDYFRSAFEKQVVYIDNVNTQSHRTTDAARGDREMSAGMMRERVRGFQEDRRRELRTLVEAAREQKPPARSDIPAAAIRQGLSYDYSKIPPALWDRVASLERRKASRLEREKQMILNSDRLISKFKVEIHKKYSIPLACPVFVMIGAPLGIMARTSGIGMGVAYSLAFFILYWCFLIGGESLADNLKIPAWLSMWAPNILLGGAGGWLILRMVQEKDFVSYLRVANLFARIRARFRWKKAVQ